MLYDSSQCTHDALAAGYNPGYRLPAPSSENSKDSHKARRGQNGKTVTLPPCHKEDKGNQKGITGNLECTTHDLIALRVSGDK